MTTYTCIGSVRGSCGVRHRTVTGAARCLARDWAGCHEAGGYSDRCIVRSDGLHFVLHEDETAADAELRAEQFQ